jgi:hypothetical protein
MDFGLVIGFIDHLQVLITNNNNTVTDFHTLQITAANSKPFPASCIFSSHFMATASNNGYYLASVP